MNDPSKQKSVNSRRSFIVMSGLAAYWQPPLPSQKQRLAEVWNAKVSWFQQVHRRLGIRSIIFRETGFPFM
jgi:hypothetical protein